MSLPNRKGLVIRIVALALLVTGAIFGGTTVADYWNSRKEAIAFALAEPERVVEAKVTYQKTQEDAIKFYKETLSRVFIEEK